MSKPTTTPPEAKPKFLDEELSRTLLSEFLDGAPDKKEPEGNKPAGDPPAADPAPEPKEEVPPAPAADPALEPKPEPVKKKAKAPKVEKPEPIAPPTAEEIGTSVAKAVAREMRQNQQPAPEVKPVIVVEDDLPPAERRLQNNLAALAKLYPDEYGTVHTERKKFVDRLRTYEQEWIKNNPGEQFNPDAEEHNEFYSTDPMQKVSSEHLAEAIAEQLMAEKAREIEQRIQQSERARQTEPVAASVAADAANGIVKELGGDLAIKINPNGQIDHASYQAALEADPLRAPIIADAAERAAKISSEVVRIYSGAVSLDPGKNPEHLAIVKFGSLMERKMAALKPDQWNDPKGRSLEDFLPSDKFWSLTPAQRRIHWTFDQEDMVNMVRGDIEKDTKNIISAEEGRVSTIIAKRNGGVPTATPKAQPGNAPQRENQPAAPSKPTSPSGRGQPNLAGPTGGKPGGNKTVEDSWIAGF